MAENAWEVLARSQRAAVSLLADAVSRLVEMGRTGVTHPDEVLHQVTEMVSAVGELAGATAQPLEMFMESQRQLAETMAAYAVLQRQLADVLETAAANQAAIVQALELMTSPVVGVAHRLRPEQAKDAAKKSSTSKSRAPRPKA